MTSQQLRAALVAVVGVGDAAMEAGQNLMFAFERRRGLRPAIEPAFELDDDLAEVVLLELIDHIERSELPSPWAVDAVGASRDRRIVVPLLALIGRAPATEEGALVVGAALSSLAHFRGRIDDEPIRQAASRFSRFAEADDDLRRWLTQ